MSLLKIPPDFCHFYGILVAVCLAICPVEPVSCQADQEVERFGAEHGLSQGTINDLLQDREGFLWIGTKDGLNRYDGYEFRVFTNDPNDPWSISGNTIINLYEDSQGRLWAAADNSGINIYDKHTGRFHHILYDPLNPEGLSGTYIATIVEDTSGYFILNMDEREINMFRLEDAFFDAQQDPHIIRIAMPAVERRDSSLNTLVKGLVRDSLGRIWVGGQDRLFRLDVNRAQLTLVSQAYSVGTTLANANGTYWSCGMTYPLSYLDGEIIKPFPGNITWGIDLASDQSDNLWVLRIDSLFRFNTRPWIDAGFSETSANLCDFRWQPVLGSVGCVSKNKSDCRDNFPLKSLTIDQSGAIWVGSNGYGLFKLNTNRELFAHRFPGVSIRHIVPAPDHACYLMSYDGTWYVQSDQFLQAVDPTQLPELANVDQMLYTAAGIRWQRHVVVNQGDFTVRQDIPGTASNHAYEIGWQHYDFQPMMGSRDGSIWMAGFNDVLTRIDPVSGSVTSYDLHTGERSTHADQPRVISQEYSTALYEDNDGILWVGSERGMTKCLLPTAQETIKTVKFNNIPGDRSSLSYDHITCFLDDPSQPDRFLWIATKGGGLNRLDKRSGQFMQLTRHDGLPDNVIYGILADDDGNIWGSTNNGLFCLTIQRSPENEAFTYIFRSFSKRDGLQSDEFNTGAYAKLADGRLLFGGINGINVIDPKNILAGEYAPNVYITNIAVNNNPVRPGDDSGILSNTIEHTSSLTLSPEQDILTLEYASLDFSNPDRNRYRYQLIGANETWVEAGARRTATFVHLPPGKYTFRVQGSNSRGIWSPHSAELGILVLPPWYRTWWAYSAYAAVIAICFWLYMRFSIHRTKLREQLAFEKREADRIKELDGMKTQLFVNMTHEFRTPLAIILGMARQTLDNPKEHFRSGLEMIIRNGESLLSLVNKMLSLSRLEGGKLSLDLVQGDIVLFLRNLVESFRSLAGNKEIQLHFLPEVNTMMMDYDPDKVQQVVSNLISNAFKFTDDGGHIYISIRSEGDELSIRVKDTGRGIPIEAQAKIFDRFYQVDDSNTRQYEGTGIGLALCSELVKLMQGSIAVESPPVGSARGSEFIVRLPVTHTAMMLENAPILQQVAEQPLPPEQQSSTVVAGVPAQQKATIKSNTEPVILLTEDNPDVAVYVAACLPEYQLALAADGKEGLDMAIELVPDLVITDVMMPVMDGFAFCRQLKSDERTDHIPVIMLTARADLDSKLEGLELGANAYLPKPFEKQELLLTIRNLFDLREKLQRHYRGIAGLVEATEPTDTRMEGVSTKDAFVIKVTEIIQMHLREFDFNVERLASILHLSHSQVGRKLDALTGYSPNLFIRMIRLNHAKELLRTTEESITAIAYDCGFSDPGYFTRIFKKTFGMTPSEWRDKDIVV